ncbi:MAG: RIP metalloprotease RseP [Candidatus Gastranaerophilales bacterium]|nr:RIP metalloprotease RseP [Candidatus Gastranaerophilales bacterium]
MNQLIMILLISMLVLVHEAGHYIAARMCGVRVTRFGIGMPIGPSWKLFKLGDTVFYLHAFLFGGYVSFAEPESQVVDESQETNKKQSINEIQEDEFLPADSAELYDNKTIAQKLFIVSAGVIMNIVFAIILVMFCAVCFHKLPTSNQNLYVDSFVAEKTSNIENFNVKKGDKIHKVNGIKVNSLYQLTFFAKNSKLFDDYAQEDLIEKNIENLKKLNPQIKNDLILEGQEIKLPKAIEENELKANENMLKGLEKYKKDGLKLSADYVDLRNEIYNKKTYRFKKDTELKDVAIALSDTYKPLSITFIRNDKEYTINNVIVGEKGILGVKLKIEDIFMETKTPKDVVINSMKYIYTTTSTMLFGLWQLITGKVPASDMHGIIAVTKLGGDIIASKGIINGILLTAMISINLAIMNFLPIPALDGGHVMFLVIEKITGRKPDKDLSEKINNFFFMLLIILMVAICYNDILALVTKKF